MTGYRDRFYRAYLSTHLGTYRPVTPGTIERDRRLFRALYRRFLPISRDATILEVGCGAGTFLAFLLSEGYRRVHGIDRSAEQIALARQLGVEKADVAEALTYLPAHPVEYDLIVAMDVIEHFGKDEVLAFLDGAYGALRPGGRILLRTPNADCPYHSWIRYVDFTHEVSFTPTSIKQVLRVAGFTAVQVVPLEPYTHGLPSAGRWLLWQIVKAGIRLYFLIEQGVPGSGIFTTNLCAVGQKP